jgi:D-alanyl-D-alanine carboxypeptidase
MRRVRSLVSAIALSACLLAAPPALAREPAPLPDDEARVIDEAVREHMAADGLVGVTVSLRAPGRSFLRSYGTADLDTGRPLDPSDHYRIASVTKTFTATAVLRLVQRGRIGFEDHLEDYVAGIPYGDEITIRQLLAMRAGVFNFIDDQTFIDAYNADPLLPGWEPEDIVPILQRNASLATPPGLATVYSDSNYVLLGLILEKVTGRPVERHIEDRVIRPLGLRHTSFPTTPAMPEPFAHGYDSSFGPLEDLTFSTPAVPWTAGAIVSTVPDMTRYAEQLATGALLDPETLRARLDFGTIPNPGGPRAGYGLGILRIGDWIGHNGAIFCYSTSVYHLPDSRVTIIVMVNTASTTLVAADPIFGAIAEQLYPDSFPPG